MAENAGNGWLPKIPLELGTAIKFARGERYGAHHSHNHLREYNAGKLRGSPKIDVPEIRKGVQDARTVRVRESEMEKAREAIG